MTMASTDPRDKLPLHGRRLELTALLETDLPFLEPFFQDIASLTYYIPTTARPLNRPQLRSLLADWNDGIENFVFAIRKGDRLIGLINLDGLDWPNSHTEIGIALTASGERGHGLAAEALTLLIEYAFTELGLHRIWARIIENNTPSVRLFTRLGFRLEGRLRQHVRRRGQYRDMLVYGLLPEDWTRAEVVENHGCADPLTARTDIQA
jgi:RimJ/RimL family protein N-acetyltransferase